LAHVVTGALGYSTSSDFPTEVCCAAIINADVKFLVPLVCGDPPAPWIHLGTFLAAIFQGVDGAIMAGVFVQDRINCRRSISHAQLELGVGEVSKVYLHRIGRSLRVE
jgi:hypothetical protein